MTDRRDEELAQQADRVAASIMAQGYPEEMALAIAFMVGANWAIIHRTSLAIKNDELPPR